LGTTIEPAAENSSGRVSDGEGLGNFVENMKKYKT